MLKHVDGTMLRGRGDGFNTTFVLIQCGCRAEEQRKVLEEVIISHAEVTEMGIHCGLDTDKIRNGRHSVGKGDVFMAVPIRELSLCWASLYRVQRKSQSTSKPVGNRTTVATKVETVACKRAHHVRSRQCSAVRRLMIGMKFLPTSMCITTVTVASDDSLAHRGIDLVDKYSMHELAHDLESIAFKG